MRILRNYPKFFFAALAALFFLPFLGGVHLFDWDEVNFAEIAREMVILGNYLEIHVNFIPFTEKPPGFFWLQALSMKLFGIGEYAARFPNAVFGIITLPTLYYLGNKIKGHQFGVFWALAYFGSILPHLYFKSGIIDPVFNYFIFMGLTFLIFFVWKKEGNTEIDLSKSKWFYLFFAGVFTGFGILVKGPVAYLITGLSLAVYWVIVKFKFYIKPLEFIAYTLAALLASSIWYGVEYLVNGSKFIIEFIIRQWTIFSTPDAGHVGFTGYHFVVLLLGCFPASAFAILAMTKRDTESQVAVDYKKWMTILFWVVLILFTIVKSKIVHYSSMAYFPITYLAAVSLQKLSEGEWTFNRLTKFFYWLTAIPVIAAPLLATYIGMNPDVGKRLLSKDPFAVANLDAQINWTGWEVLPTFFIIGIVVFSFYLFLTSQKLLGSGHFREIKIRKASWILFGGTAIWMFMTLIFFIGKVERISQNANIEFWKSKKDEKAYLTDYHYKTYTHLFYGEVKRNDPPESRNSHYLLHGDVDRPVYISTKIHRRKQLEQEIKDAEFLYEKNGFVFYVRQPK